MTQSCPIPNPFPHTAPRFPLITTVTLPQRPRLGAPAQAPTSRQKEMSFKVLGEQSSLAATLGMGTCFGRELGPTSAIHVNLDPLLPSNECPASHAKSCRSSWTLCHSTWTLVRHYLRLSAVPLRIPPNLKSFKKTISTTQCRKCDSHKPAPNL